jgi:hypothetical protein
MNEKKILEMVGRLREWCYEILDDGPTWSRNPASDLICRCNRFSSRLNENLMFLSDYYRCSWNDVCKMMQEALFDGHDQFCLDDCLGPAVLGLCLKTGRRAPDGWHGRLLRKKKYREMFRSHKK